MKYGPGDFRLSVRDDGCGIDPSILEAGRDGHFGLSGMRERADRMGARLHVYSSPSAGTEIELTVPARLAFQHQSRRKFPWFRNGKRNGAAPSPAQNRRPQ
jgi:nitrate/nitrite-specific signal transduction histidine kinase